MNLLAPWGFYGSGNIGDEATLQGFARLVARAPQPIRVWVGSRNPRHTAQVEPSFRYFYHPVSPLTRRWVNFRTSGVVLAGGTPIMDCHGDWPLNEVVPLMEAAHQRGRPVVVVGSGTERLRREQSRRIMAERLAPIVRYWTVRSEPDEARLLEYGVAPERVRVAGDMAWLLAPVSPDWGKRQLNSWGVPEQSRLIGVNLIYDKPIRERHPKLYETVACFLDRLVEKQGASILFLANDVHEIDGFDKSAALHTQELMKHARQAFLAPNRYWSPQRMMSLIANCHATVSMRYHFCLFSALQGVPFVALKRSDKVADLCWDLQWPFGSLLKDLGAEGLLDSYEALESQRAKAVRELALRMPILRERASRNTVALEALHEQ